MPSHITQAILVSFVKETQAINSIIAPYAYVFTSIFTYNKFLLMVIFMIFTIFRCECPFGFDGPRCQQVRHSFSGNGWAEYKTLPQCGNGSTIIEVLTTQSNGLVMYNGPRKNPGKKMSYFCHCLPIKRKF